MRSDPVQTAIHSDRIVRIGLSQVLPRFIDKVSESIYFLIECMLTDFCEQQRSSIRRHRRIVARLIGGQIIEKNAVVYSLSFAGQMRKRHIHDMSRIGELAALHISEVSTRV